ncbi:MAG TPA: hypothetical protein GX709_04795 [Clostridiales bacterium]|nr:hypothetical protein [Clostridiales bacterium]
MKKTKKISIAILLVLILTVSTLLVACSDAKAEAYFEEDVRYMIDVDNLDMLPKADPALVNTIKGFLDPDEAYMEFDTEGNFTFQLLFNDFAVALIDNIGAILGVVEVLGVEMGREGIDDFAESYLDTFFPGFHFDNLAESLDIARRDFGFEFVGLEEGSYALKALDENFRNGGFPNAEIQLNLKKFGIKYTGKYFLKDVYSKTTDTKYHGVFLGKDRPKTTPYVGMTIDGDDILVFVELIGLDFTATKYVEPAAQE